MQPPHFLLLILLTISVFFGYAKQEIDQQREAPVVASQVQQGKIFEQNEGSWKASCFVDRSSPEPYCRIMVVHFFNASQQSLNFAQFGPAFDRAGFGFIIASYYGYTPESRITVGIDGNPPLNIPAPPMGNHIVIPANLTKTLLDQMETGTSIQVEFKPVLGGVKTLKYPLTGYQELKKKIGPILAQHNTNKEK